MKKQGGIEIGKHHYKYIVLVHVFFFLSLVIEYLLSPQGLSPFSIIILFFFLLTQFIRVWAIKSLGVQWNTKIIILPGRNMVTKGPYQYLKHPNYVVVILEILLIPLLFQAYYTALLFTLLNLIVLSIRIPIEEKALMDATDYAKAFEDRMRFVPKAVKR